jgi:hypothetical protein
LWGFQVQRFSETLMILGVGVGLSILVKILFIFIRKIKYITSNLGCFTTLAFLEKEFIKMAKTSEKRCC